MNNDRIIKATTLDQLKHLYDCWAMTWEGLNTSDFEKALDCCGTPDAKGYHMSGKTMNELCKLTGDNRYPDDLNIFSIDKYKGLAMRYGARWMTDVIDNNLRRENITAAHIFRA